jgi:hypothetical protein
METHDHVGFSVGTDDRCTDLSVVQDSATRAQGFNMDFHKFYYRTLLHRRE